MFDSLTICLRNLPEGQATLLPKQNIMVPDLNVLSLQGHTYFVLFRSTC